MVNSQAEYKKYVEAINLLAGLQDEAEKSHQQLASAHTNRQRQLEAERQQRIQQLEKIREAAVCQFKDLSLLFREVCNVPAAVASPEPNTASLMDATRMQGAAAAELKQALDDIIAQRLAAKQQAIATANDQRERERQEAERLRLEEQRRLNAEVRRRQQELDNELHRAGRQSNQSNDYRVRTD